MADAPESPNQNAGGGSEAPAAPEHLNIKVTDNNNEVFFKIKRNTKLEKLMLAFCERQGKTITSVRFLFEGQRVQPTDTPDTVRTYLLPQIPSMTYDRRGIDTDRSSLLQLEMADGDTLEVHQEQVGGC